MSQQERVTVHEAVTGALFPAFLCQEIDEVENVFGLSVQSVHGSLGGAAQSLGRHFGHQGLGKTSKCRVIAHVMSPSEGRLWLNLAIWLTAQLLMIRDAKPTWRQVISPTELWMPSSGARRNSRGQMPPLRTKRTTPIGTFSCRIRCLTVEKQRFPTSGVTMVACRRWEQAASAVDRFASRYRLC
ncbi:MAG: hypothetical protein ACKVP7_00015 [Hyphomicrobiaceae bacterium]